MNIETDEYVLPWMFKMCPQLATTEALQFAKKIFDEMPDRFRKDTILNTASLHMIIMRGQSIWLNNCFIQ